MSLQVWLPLTKDLRQQGLDNITITTANTNNFQNEGKLGSKSLDVSGHYAFRVPSLVKKRVFSCAFWYKPITDSSLSDNWRRIIVFDTYTSDGSTAGAIFRFESSYGYQSSNTTYCISIHNNVGEPIASIGTGLGASDGWNKWQHIVITADGTTLKCYRDGMQVASGAMSNGGMLQGTVHIGYSGNRPVGRLNDFRLYDHCLSPMEVKEFAKGLVLHYPLNRQGWGQENLIAGTDFNGSSQKYTVTSGTEGGFTYTPTETILANTEYTVSCQLRGSANMNLYKLCTGGNEAISWVNRSQLSTTEYRPFSITFTYPSSKTLNQIYICTRYGTSSTSTGDWFEIKPNSLKLEKGSVATPWCPNSSDTLATTMGLNETTEYDCSGFCNNANSNGSVSLTYSSDTPKYNVSTVFASGARIATPISASTFLPTDAITVSIWFKSTNAANRFLSCTEGGGFNFESASGKISFPIYITDKGYTRVDGNTTWSEVSDNKWHMITATYDKQNTILYVDGQLDKSTVSSYPNIDISYSTVTPFTLGAEAQTITSPIAGIYVGNLSDCRIYATALSADDVQSLYQNSAYIDSSGNVYGAVHSEV